MSRRLKFSDMKSRIDWALRQFSENSGTKVGVPIDLARLCECVGISVQWRLMIPEGVMAVESGRLTVYLQENFIDDSRMRTRQRFTWAHEICHALLYDDTGSGPKPMDGMPGGAALEQLCQQGAAHLLMPSESLESCRKDPIASITAFDALAARFDVSAEAMLRRLHEADGTVAADYGIFLLRRVEDEYQVRASAYGSWLTPYLVRPALGERFEKWSGPLLNNSVQISPDSWERVIDDSVLTIKRQSRAAITFVEFRIRGKT
jgi:hypothetical protein